MTFRLEAFFAAASFAASFSESSFPEAALEASAFWSFSLSASSVASFCTVGTWSCQLSAEIGGDRSTAGVSVPCCEQSKEASRPSNVSDFNLNCNWTSCLTSMEAQKLTVSDGLLPWTVSCVPNGRAPVVTTCTCGMPRMYVIAEPTSWKLLHDTRCSIDPPHEDWRRN